MEFIKLNPEQYEAWDKFCLEGDEAWFWHTSSWIFYNLNYRSEYKPADFSFLCEENSKIIAVCPLILENHDGINEFSFGGYGLPVPALLNGLSFGEKNKVLKAIFSHIDDLAKENGVKRAKFRFSVLDKAYLAPDIPSFNFLSKFGYLDTSINTQIIDVQRGLTQLTAELRHGHKSDIKSAEKTLTVEICDFSNINPLIYEKYKDLRILLSGQKPRSGKSFELMYDFIKNGLAFLAVAKGGDELAGFSYFFNYKSCVYYGSACNYPAFEKSPVAHIIQWEAIKWMKAKNIRYYEIGWQNFSPSLSDLCTEKELSISKFKRGFGGFTAPLFMGEKYYDKDYFLSVYEARLKKYAETFDKKKEDESRSEK